MEIELQHNWTVDVERYYSGKPMRITGSGFGDCEPPEPEEIDYTVYDDSGVVDYVLTPEEERMIIEKYKYELDLAKNEE